MNTGLRTEDNQVLDLPRDQILSLYEYSPLPPSAKYEERSYGDRIPFSVTMPDIRCGGVMSNAG